MIRHALCALFLILPAAARSQTLAVPADSSHWDLEGGARAVEHQGRACLELNGGTAALKDCEFTDGIIDADVSFAGSPFTRGFAGIQFRADTSFANAEWIYLRPHKSTYPDAIQYTPVLRTGANWQLYNGAGFNAAVDLPRDTWIHVRLEVSGAQAKLFVSDTTRPALVMDDLKSGLRKGAIALYVLTGTTYFSNFSVRSTPEAPWQRHEPAMAPGTLVRWQISSAYDALARNLERPPSRAEADTMRWQDVEAEPPGFVVLYRYRDAPHIRVSFDRDFSKRLEPQPGTKVLYARTTIDSDRDRARKLEIGYSDEVSVFLNGRILWRGRSAQYFRDPAFLGIVNAENDAVYLPLHKGKNDLMLAVSELGGGWGYMCRLGDAGK
jgi:hypothetical protein